MRGLYHSAFGGDNADLERDFNPGLIVGARGRLEKRSLCRQGAVSYGKGRALRLKLNKCMKDKGHRRLKSPLAAAFIVTETSGRIAEKFKACRRGPAGG